LTRHNHSTATPTAAPIPSDSRNWPSGWPNPPLVLASTAPNTAAPKMPADGACGKDRRREDGSERRAGRDAPRNRCGWPSRPCSGLGKILLAATLQAAIFAVVKAAFDRNAAEAMLKLTGIWPVDECQQSHKSA
jgi:hypothetical protein